MQWCNECTAVQLFHRDCGELVTVQLTCAAGHGPLGAIPCSQYASTGTFAVVDDNDDTHGERPEDVAGVEPDYRFTLANERTFLAWERTALGLLAAAVAVVQLVPELAIAGARHVLGVMLALLAILTAGMGILRWEQVDRAMRRGLPLPRHPRPVYLGIGLLVVGLITLGLVVVKAVAAW